MRTRNIILMLVSLMLTSCHVWHGVRGSGDLSEEYRDIESFERVEISGAFNFRLIVGEEPMLKLSGDDNLLKYVKTRVVGNTLKIELSKNVNSKNPMSIDASTDFLESLEASGANKIKVSGVDCERFDLDMSGANKAELSGKTNRFDVGLSGATKLNAFDFFAEQVKVSCSGASKAEVFAEENLNADASGASHISFKGNARVKSDVSGAASISRY